MQQQKNQIAKIKQENTFSIVGYFKASKKLPCFRQYETESLRDDKLKLEGGKLARYHIGTMLQHIYQMVGLKPENEPSPELARTIARYIQKTYHYLNPDDLYQAFEFALQGKYKVELEHFGVMDLKYLNRVLAAYCKYRTRIMAKIQDKTVVEKIQSRINHLIESRSLDDAAVKNLLLEKFQSVVKNQETQDYLREEYFDWMCDIGLIPLVIKELNYAVFRKFKYSQEKVSYKDVCRDVKIENIVTIMQKWGVDKINPMTDTFKNVSFIAVDNINELIYLKNMLQDEQQKEISDPDI